MRFKQFRVTLICMLWVTIVLGQQATLTLPDDVKHEYDLIANSLDYNQHIKPILSDKCFACHGNDANKRQAQLRLDNAAGAYGPLPISPGSVAIYPFKPTQSELVKRILTTDPLEVMPEPKSNMVLTAREKAILIKWIEQGAEYKPHWAFIPPVMPEVPVIRDQSWCKNGVDNFIVQKLESENLIHNAPASKEILLRRLYFDLTGLPPGLNDLQDFMIDNSPSAYEKQVDKLLASPHFGEKMAVDWLDLARFADSHGYTVDRIRDMSPYRDWVIKAYNDNLRYDKFIQYQLAGDLMPNPTRSMKIATAFNRNHPQNLEGGIVEEEFQTEYVIDRTNTTGEVFMGLSFGCARCHDHKFDPISQKNYYELFSFFNNVREAGQISWNGDMPTPTLLLASDEQEKIIAFIQKSIDCQEAEKEDYKLQKNPGFDQWLQSGSYQFLSRELIPQNGLMGHFDFEDSLCNTISSDCSATIRRETDTTAEKINLVPGANGKALLLDGDNYLYVKGLGVFSKDDPFSISAWVKIPPDFEEGVLWHKSIAERLYNFKGYHLYYKQGHLELSIAHTAPSNAITRITQSEIPKNVWMHLAMTYDGSSKAGGARLYLDGNELNMLTTMDQLSKDILFHQTEEPPLQIGGWWRGKGFKLGQVDDLLVYNRTLTSHEVTILAKKSAWATIADKPFLQLTTSDLAILKDYYLIAFDSAGRQIDRELTAWRRKLTDTIQDIPELMVMQESQLPRQAHLLRRGDYSDPGEAVYPAVPSQILPFDQKNPTNRYGLALWLTDARHPLTARVMVNRAWQTIFGTGLVKTSEDFGFQGEPPSHPALLDWLSVSFIQSGWDYKKLIKMMVMSATYQQDSRRNDESLSKDPENRWLSAGPSARLTAEMMRDNVLFASGLLQEDIGGKSIYPYQPSGLWEINSARYVQDTTQQVYRRSMYIVTKRSVPNPTLATFDAPDRSQCLSRRQKTNTPMQALVLLNDPTFLEASLAMGDAMSEQKDLSSAITQAYKQLTSRDPTETQLELLKNFLISEYQKFKDDPTKIAGWLHAGLYRIDPTRDSLWIAANAVAANLIMNSDATITKR